jgi:hypothetical protein
LDWPCGQNPGRKPEGRRRASTREAMSLGKQSSTCRASFLSALLKRTEFRPRGTREGSWAASPKAWAPLWNTTYWSSRTAAARNGHDRAGRAALCRRHFRAGGRLISGTGHPARSRTLRWRRRSRVAASSRSAARVRHAAPNSGSRSTPLPATAGSTRSAEDPRDRELSPLSGKCREAGLAGTRRPVEEAAACEAGLGSAPRRRLAAR